MPCYLVIDGKKQEMDEDIFDQMVEALHQRTIQEPPMPSNANIHKMATRRNLWQETQRPTLLLKILSKEIINPFHLSRLRTDNFVQIQFIKTSSNQDLYEEEMSVLKSKIFSIPSGKLT